MTHPQTWSSWHCFSSANSNSLRLACFPPDMKTNEIRVWCVLENSTVVLIRRVPIPGPCSPQSDSSEGAGRAELSSSVPGWQRCLPQLLSEHRHACLQAGQCPPYSSVLTAYWTLRSLCCHSKHSDLRPTGASWADSFSHWVERSHVYPTVSPYAETVRMRRYMVCSPMSVNVSSLSA